MLALRSALCDSVMKLMGIGKLEQLGQAGPADLAGAVAALFLELKAAKWAALEDVIRAYPQARTDGIRVEIDLDADHHVAMRVNYEAGCLMIDGGGSRGDASGGAKRKRK